MDDISLKTIIFVTSHLFSHSDDTVLNTVLLKLLINNFSIAQICVAVVKKTKINKEKCFLQITHFPDIYFKDHFRMEKSSFEILLNKLTIIKNCTEYHRNEYVAFSTQLLITIWILATPDSFRSVAERFNVSKGTAHYIYVSMVKKILKLSKIYVSWPSLPQIDVIKKSIEKKSNFPEVVGFIDGTHIQFKAPKESTRYFNRKKSTSLILQAVCNNKLEFIDIYFGEVGSLHDNRVYTRSPLSQLIRRNPQQYLGHGGHLLGDAAYMLTTTMMTPYKNNGHLTDEENLYNEIHAGLRSNIERAFALLKGKWRRLKFLDASVFEYIRDHILACCILHNFLIHVGDDSADSNINISLDFETSISSEEQQQGYEAGIAAQKKRNDIAALLYEKVYCL